VHGVGQDPRGIAGIGRVDEDRSVSLGAADDEQQLEIEAPSAGHRAPSAPRLAGVVALRVARPLDPVIDRRVEGWLADIRPGGGCRLGDGGS
jgi:hypothetical protein